MEGNRLLGIATQIMVMAVVISVLLLFVGVGVLVLIHVCIVWRAFRRGLRTMGRGERCDDGSGAGLSPEDLGKLPCYEFERAAGEKWPSGPADCAVCLESFRVGDRCRLLPPCGHSFHAICVDSWLLQSPICPICRSCADHSP